jgi:hypothetical protein
LWQGYGTLVRASLSSPSGESGVKDQMDLFPRGSKILPSAMLEEFVLVEIHMIEFLCRLFHSNDASHRSYLFTPTPYATSELCLIHEGFSRQHHAHAE